MAGAALLASVLLLWGLNELARSSWIWQDEHRVLFDVSSWGYRLGVRIVLPLGAALIVSGLFRYAITREARNRSESVLRLSNDAARKLRRGVILSWGVLAALAVVTLANGYITPELYERFGIDWPVQVGTWLEELLRYVGVPLACGVFTLHFVFDGSPFVGSSQSQSEPVEVYAP